MGGNHEPPIPGNSHIWLSYMETMKYDSNGIARVCYIENSATLFLAHKQGRTNLMAFHGQAFHTEQRKKNIYIYPNTLFNKLHKNPIQHSGKR